MRIKSKATFYTIYGKVWHGLSLLFFLLFTFNAISQPVINSFSPDSGPAGTTVIIKGTGFNSVSENNTVYFGKTKATVIAATSTSLTVAVPISADFLPISVTANNLTAYSAKPFITTFQNCSTSPTIAFAPTLDVATDKNPNSILLADLDGDGKPDAFNTYNEIPKISISRNTSTAGQIIFEKAKNLDNHYFMSQVKAADVDGDGKQDLLTVNWNNASISVFLNRSTPGNFSFLAPYHIKCGGQPFDVSIGDLDGDGKPEIVIPRKATDDLFANSIIQIYKNSSTPGQLSFTAPVEIETTDIYTMKIAIQDLDNDNKPEMLAMNNWTFNITIYKNNSTVNNLSFARSNVLSTEGLYPRSMAVGDLDEDGKPDIVITSYTSTVDQINIFRNTTENSTISFGPKQNFYTNRGPWDCFLGDLNGDKKLDIAVACYVSTSNSVTLHQNTSVPGKISFGNMVSLPTASSPQDVYINDIDGDGRADIAAAAYLGNAISFLRNNEPQKPLFTTTIKPSTCTSSYSSISNGKISIQPHYNETYYYSWNNDIFTTDPTLNYLKNGTYVVQVKNAAGCIAADTFFVPGTGGPTFTIEEKSDVCKTAISLKINAANGTTPYTYSLDGTNYQDQNIFDKLRPNTFNITVKDANGCATSQTTIIEGSDLKLNAFGINATCGFENGTVGANATGGTSPYVYSLNGSVFSANKIFNALPSGNYSIRVKDANGCMTDSSLLLADGCLNIAADVTHTTCGNENGKLTVKVNNGTAPFLYALNGQQFVTTNEFTNLKPGLYEITVKDIHQLKGKIKVSINESTIPKISVVSTPASCLDNNGTITIEGSGSSLPYKYSLGGNSFQQRQDFGGLSSGEHIAYVEDAMGCVTKTRVTIPLKNTIALNVSEEATVCEGAPIRLDATSNATTFSWSPANSLNNSHVLNPIATPLTSTAYKVTATMGACTETKNILVTVLKAPKADAGKDVTICKEQDAQLTAVAGYMYNWKTTLNLNNAAAINPVAAAPPPGRHAVLLDVTDNFGCTSLIPDTAHITVIDPVIDLGKDTFILASTPLQLLTNDPAGSGFIKYQWHPATGLNHTNTNNPIAFIENDITYTVTAETSQGCTATDNIQIKVFKNIEIFVPNAFTPNNDGRNDLLKAIPVGIKKFSHFSVWNRWGQLVFSTTDPTVGWNGTWKSAMQEGVFVWAAEAVDYHGNKISRKGTVLLIR